MILLPQVERVTHYRDRLVWLLSRFGVEIRRLPTEAEPVLAVQAEGARR
jgi:hypothetical protein